MKNSPKLYKLYSILLKDMKIEIEKNPPLFICCVIDHMNTLEENKTYLRNHFHTMRDIAIKEFNADRNKRLYSWWEKGTIEENEPNRLAFIEYLIKKCKEENI